MKIHSNVTSMVFPRHSIIETFFLSSVTFDYESDATSKAIFNLNETNVKYVVSEKKSSLKS